VTSTEAVNTYQIAPRSRGRANSLFTLLTWTRQNCLVLSALAAEHNCRQDKTVLYCPCTWCKQLFGDKTRQFCLVSNCVDKIDKTVLYCPCRWCKHNYLETRQDSFVLSTLAVWTSYKRHWGVECDPQAGVCPPHYGIIWRQREYGMFITLHKKRRKLKSIKKTITLPYTSCQQLYVHQICGDTVSLILMHCRMQQQKNCFENGQRI